MRKLLIGLVAVGVAVCMTACSGGPDATTDVTPKGNAPETVQAPEGAKNPEERGMEEQRAAEGQSNGQFGSDQDGGGQDGK